MLSYDDPVKFQCRPSWSCEEPSLPEQQYVHLFGQFMVTQTVIKNVKFRPVYSHPTFSVNFQARPFGGCDFATLTHHTFEATHSRPLTSNENVGIRWEYNVPTNI